MTTAIEVTKREMYASLKNLKDYADSANQGASIACEYFERFLENHLEELRKAMVAINESTVACAQPSSEAFVEQERRIMALTTERDTLRNRVQVLDLANQTSGDVIRSLKQEVGSLKREASQARKNLMAARLAEVAASVSVPPYNASGAALDGKTGTILGAVVDCQRIVTDWSLKTIKAKEAMYLISSAVHDPVVKSAVKAFEQPKCDHFTESGEGGMCRKCGEMVFGKDTIWVWTKPHCMHSFHPAFPSGELCTFCGVGK